MSLTRKHFVQLARILGENEARMMDGNASAINLIRLRDEVAAFCRVDHQSTGYGGFDSSTFQEAIGDARNAYQAKLNGQ